MATDRHGAMKRSLIIIAVTGVVVIVGLAISLAVVATARGSSCSRKDEALCLTFGCVKTAARILEDINQKVRPCDDFYEFACGGYRASAPMPDDKLSVDHFTSLTIDIENQLKLIVEEPSAVNEAWPLRLAKTYYNTCMNIFALDKMGVEPLRDVLRQFGNWPVVEGDNWKEDSFNWVESVYKSRELGYSLNSFVSFDIDVDLTNSTKFMLELDRPVFGLPREALVMGMRNSAVHAYFHYMVDIAVLLGANRRQAARELRESLDFEIKLANITLSDERRQNFTILNNRMTITELNKKYPFVNWEEYINKLLSQSVHVDANEIVRVSEPDFISELHNLLNNTSKRVHANYALWRVVADSVKYLNEDMRRLERKYTLALFGNILKTSKPRWKECLAIVTESSLSLSIHALYVRKFFRNNNMQNVSEMVNNIHKELIESLEKADWMDETTRSRALEKTRAMSNIVGYPVELLDNRELRKYFFDLSLMPHDFLGNYLQMKLFRLKHHFGLLKKPVNKTDWVMHDFSTEVNAFYNPHENSIQIPAGILQGTFFSNDRPRYMNYGPV